MDNDYISKYDIRFVTFMSRKYRNFDKNVRFRNFDEYVLWLYDDSASEENYYSRLEDDLKEYSDWQTKEGDRREQDIRNKR